MIYFKSHRLDNGKWLLMWMEPSTFDNGVVPLPWDMLGRTIRLICNAKLNPRAWP